MKRQVVMFRWAGRTYAGYLMGHEEGSLRIARLDAPRVWLLVPRSRILK